MQEVEKEIEWEEGPTIFTDARASDSDACLDD